jgi:hypothetical protein
MLRVVTCVAVVLALVLFVGFGTAADQPKPQMVQGTIKVVDASKNVLIVNQKVKDQTVERQLDIRAETEFEITANGETQKVSGKDGLKLLAGREGADVKVKCDKDVNVLKVTVSVKK